MSLALYFSWPCLKCSSKPITWSNLPPSSIFLFLWVQICHLFGGTWVVASEGALTFPCHPASLHPKQHHTADRKDVKPSFSWKNYALFLQTGWLLGLLQLSLLCFSAGVPWLLAGTCAVCKKAWMLLAARWWHCGVLLRHCWCNQVVSVVCAEPPQCTSWSLCPVPARAHVWDSCTGTACCSYWVKSFQGTTSRGVS